MERDGNCADGMHFRRPLHTREAARWAGMSERQLLEFARAGVIPAKKIGGCWFFSPTKLAEFFGVDE